MFTLSPSLVTLLADIVGSEGVRTDPSSLEHYGKDWLKKFSAAPCCAVFPRTTKEVQDIVRLAITHKLKLVPSGGRTGLSGGATASHGEIILSLERMNRILEFDESGGLISVEAGVLTLTVHEYLAPQGLFFPIDFASKGSSMVGGNIATNAGGIRCIRWGTMRDWVLGLTVVTGNGDILNLNGKLVKNQSGYDLRGLFIGSEGTLGIITEAILKVTDLPGDTARILCGSQKAENFLQILARLRLHAKGLSMFEYFSHECLESLGEFGVTHDPFNETYPHYGLVEFEIDNSKERDSLEDLFSSFIEEELLDNVIISASRKQADELLAIRESIPEVLNSRALLHKNDISVPVSSIAHFLPVLRECLRDAYPTCRVAVFGHLGDGNLHVNVIMPSNISKKEFEIQSSEGDKKLFELISRWKGSISAEHGVGLLKKPYLHYCREEPEIQLMKSIKKILDPHLVLNPGKLFDL
jgi:FAD/FMN-containing dehydrogenase